MKVTTSSTENAIERTRIVAWVSKKKLSSTLAREEKEAEGGAEEKGEEEKWEESQ